MEPVWIVQGRSVSAVDVAWMDQWLQAHPSGNRTALSRELCQRWNWRNGAGHLKDMACRSLLLKLQGRGLLTLPPRRTASVNDRRNRQVHVVPCEDSPVRCALAQLGPLQLIPVEGKPDLALFRFLLARHHYRGYGNTVGENVKYLLHTPEGRPVAAMLFGAGAWKCAARDRFIGWSALQRRQGLQGIANQHRFLILPWFNVPHLASHALGLAARGIAGDWQRKYGQGIELLESFVEGPRFSGTCYRAAGWQHVGATTGRTRNDDRRQPPGAPKMVFLKPLRAGWKERLLA